MNITTKAISDEAATIYLSETQSTTPHTENVRLYLRPIVEALTKKMLMNNNNDNEEEEEKQSNTNNNGSSATEKEVILENGNNINIFDHQYGKQRSDCIEEDDEEDDDDISEQRTIARMEAFLKHCTLAVPKEAIGSSSSTLSITTTNGNNNTSIKDEDDSNSSNHQSLFSLSTALIGMKDDDSSSTKTIGATIPTKGILRSLSSNATITTTYHYPQFDHKDLFIRLDLYLKCLKRVSATEEECVLPYESSKLLQARTNCLIRSLLSNVGCMSSAGPILLQLLSLVTMEVLALHILDEEVQHAMERLCRDYEHQISFASLAFLSSPEQSTKFLSPLITSYFQYLQARHERFEFNSQIESMLRSTIPAATRTLFKTTEFLSIPHVLSTCNARSKVLSQLILPSMSRDILRQTCKDDKAMLQALRDLQREIIMINGFVLPTVTSYKELVQWLGDLLNSRKRNRSSGSDADLEEDHPPQKNSTALEYKTIDKMTKRLLLSSCRTRTGGDAYFIVKDLFGCDDVVIVPHNDHRIIHNKKHDKSTNHRQKSLAKQCTIEIQVRLSSLIIKCYAKYDVFPNYMTQSTEHNNNQYSSEPLITLDTVTSETISLQAVRVCDANSSDDDDGAGLGVVLREKKTDVTGKRILSIKPAKYARVAVWNTPS